MCGVIRCVFFKIFHKVQQNSGEWNSTWYFPTALGKWHPKTEYKIKWQTGICYGSPSVWLRISALKPSLKRISRRSLWSSALQHSCNVQKSSRSTFSPQRESTVCVQTLILLNMSNVVSEQKMSEIENEWRKNHKEQKFNLTCASKRKGIKWVKRLNTFRFVIKLLAQQPPGWLG